VGDGYEYGMGYGGEGRGGFSFGYGYGVGGGGGGVLFTGFGYALREGVVVLHARTSRTHARTPFAGFGTETETDVEVEG